MIFLKSSPLVVNQLFMNFASVDIKLSKFRNICKTAWKQIYIYFVIDLTRDYESNLKYRYKLEL